MRLGLGMAGIGAMAIASAAMSQTMNVDFNNTTGAGAGLPALGYGAASGATTTAWVGATGALGAQALGGGASLSWSASSSLFGFDNAGVAGNDALLMEDVLDLGSSTTTVRTATISGLTNGTYNVYVMAWAPDSATFLTGVAIAGGAEQIVGGAWAGGAFVAGVTHAESLGVVVGGGTLSFAVRTSSGFGSINGFQLVLVPAPAGLAVLALAGLSGRRRRN